MEQSREYQWSVLACDFIWLVCFSAAGKKYKIHLDF
jgi:hypothetical protein